MFLLSFSQLLYNYDPAEGGCYLPERKVLEVREYRTFADAQAATKAFRAIISNEYDVAVRQSRSCKEHGYSWVEFTDGFFLIAMQETPQFVNQYCTSWSTHYC